MPYESIRQRMEALLEGRSPDLNAGYAARIRHGGTQHAPIAQWDKEHASANTPEQKLKRELRAQKKREASLQKAKAKGLDTTKQELLVKRGAAKIKELKAKVG